MREAAARFSFLLSIPVTMGDPNCPVFLKSQPLMPSRGLAFFMSAFQAYLL